MRVAIGALLLAISTTTVGCMSQAEKDDIEAICFAEEKSGAKSETSQSEKAIKMADYLRGAIKTTEWKTFMKKSATMEPAKRTLTLQRAARDAGFKSCPLAES